MAWGDIEGHDIVVERFRSSLRQGRLASTFLFVGPPGIGKRTFALRLAQSLLCERVPERDLAPCGLCGSCQQIQAGTHPDLELVRKPEDRAFIPLETFVGDREHRAQAGLCYWISRKPSTGGRRIAIIDDADYLNQEGANSLLKTLEEPPPRSMLILIGTSVQRQLPTIRSRCQIIRFQPLAPELLQRLAMRMDWAPAEEQLAPVLAAANGSLTQLQMLADPDLVAFGAQLAEHWPKPHWQPWAVAKEILGFAEAAGKESAAKRLRLRHAMELVLRRLRADLDRELHDGSAIARDDDDLRCREVRLAQIERCLAALEQLDSFANLATLVEAWVDDLSQAELA